MNNTKQHDELIQEAHEFVLQNMGDEHHQRLAYHIEPPINWMNDPNGLVYFNHYYHVFFQFYPFAPKNGPKYWGHYRSKDMVNWELLPPAIAPSEEYDIDGCYSGSAIVHEGKLVLVYTGHVDNKSPKEVQCIATSEDGVHFVKHSNNPVVAGPPVGFSEDFRDPKVWKHGDQYYMVVGNGQNGHGQVLLYSSIDLLDWQFQGILAKSNGKQGFMWECPDLVRLGDKDVLILSPEGMDGIKHKSIYIVGEMNYDTKKFTQGDYQVIDYGSDFYAPQTFADDKNRVIMFGWLNLWESKMPTQEHGWVGSLTIPRELSVNQNNKLVQKPVEELKQLRKQEHHSALYNASDETTLSETLEYGEIHIEFDVTDGSNTTCGIKLRCSDDGSEETIVQLSAENKTITIDRRRSGVGDTTKMVAPLTIKDNHCVLQLFLGRSSLEVFANEGETVLSTRIYPNQTSQGIKVFSDQPINTNVTIWEF